LGFYFEKMKRLRDLKIKTKMLVAFMTTGALLTIGAGGYIIYFMKGQFIKQFSERYMAEARDNMRAIDMIMHGCYENIRSFAQDKILSGGNSTPEEITRYLKTKKEMYHYASLTYFDMNRIRIADTEGLTLGQQHHMTRYWEDVLSGKISAGADVRVTEELKIPIIYFASAVRNKEGQPIGAVVARFNPRRIMEVIEQIKEQGFHAVLLDQNRNILFASKEPLKSQVLKTKMPEIPSVTACNATTLASIF